MLTYGEVVYYVLVVTAVVFVQVFACVPCCSGEATNKSLKEFFVVAENCTPL